MAQISQILSQSDGGRAHLSYIGKISIADQLATNKLDISSHSFKPPDFPIKTESPLWIWQIIRKVNRSYSQLH